MTKQIQIPTHPDTKTARSAAAKSRLVSIKSKVAALSWKKRLIVSVILVVSIFLASKVINGSRSAEPIYQTQTIQKGTLVSTISATGSITNGNYTNVTTKASGTVREVFVTNGDTVKKGQKIAQVDLDDYARERQSDAWIAYLDAKENALDALNIKAKSDITMWNARQAVLDAQEAVNAMNDNDTNPATHAVYTDTERMIITKTLDQTRKAFSVAESKYLNGDADISNANVKVAAAYRTYQENWATVVAPSAGVITDLALAKGITVSASSSTSSTSGATIVAAQTVGKIKNPTGQLIATVNLTEIDVVKVKANQKVTLTLDAYEGKSFTGKVLAVNTNGTVSSGVTNYPVTILIDPVSVDIYPNMAVSAEIITNIIPDVLLVPSSAVTTNGTQSTLELMKNGKPTTVTVEIGSTNDSQTQILSGVAEGDEVITSTTTSTTSATQSTSISPFSGIGRSTTGGATRGTVNIISGPPGGL